MVLFSVPDVPLVGVGEFEDGGGRRHATAMQEARAEVELSEAEVEAGQHAHARHLNDVRRTVHDAQTQLAAAQHGLSRGSEGELADCRLAGRHVSGVRRHGDHLLVADGALAHLPLVIEVELASVDDVQVADAALVDLDLRTQTHTQQQVRTAVLSSDVSHSRRRS